jgi:hypothetical protein
LERVYQGAGERTGREGAVGFQNRHRRARLLRSAAVLLITLVALSVQASVPTPVLAASNPQTSNPQSIPVSIDKTLFFSTVPSYAVLGHNYTVKLLVRNTSDQPVPIILRVNIPVDVIYTHPLLLQLVVGPGQQVLTNFSLIAFNRYSGLINVTAVMWVWYFDQMPRPQIVQQVSTLIDGVTPSPLLPVALVAVVALSAAAGAAIYLGIRRSRRGALTSGSTRREDASAANVGRTPAERRLVCDNPALC